MKKFEKPEIEIKELEIMDIITASGNCELDGWGDECSNFTGWN